MFEYELVSSDLREAELKYTNRIYKPGTDVFEMFTESKEEQRMQYPLSLLDEGHESWKEALGRSNARIYEQGEEIRRLQQGTAVVTTGNQGTTFDFKDINDLFEKNGKGPHMLELDFKPSLAHPTLYTIVGSENGEQGSYWLWEHKITGVKVKRYLTISGKSFDTGILSKKLSGMRKSCGFPEAYARAKHIVLLNGNNKTSQTNDRIPKATRKERIAMQVSYFGWK